MSDLPNDAAGEEELDLPLDDDGDDGDPPEDESEGEELEGEEAGEGDDEGDGEPAPRQPAQRRPGRTERLRNELAEVKRELAEIKRAPITSQPAQPDPGARDRARAELLARLETMPPAEAIAFALDIGERRTQEVIARQGADISERLDKQAYEAQRGNSRIHQRYADRVEQVVASERALGNHVSREAVLKYLVGEDAMRRATSAAPNQRRAAARRVAAQTTRPTGARGDGAPAGRSRNQDADDDAFLRGVTAGDL